MLLPFGLSVKYFLIILADMFSGQTNIYKKVLIICLFMSHRHLFFVDRSKVYQYKYIWRASK